MRKLNYLLAMLALCVLWGCSEVEEDETVISHLSVNNNSLVFPYNGGNLTLEIVNNTDWGVSDLPEWLSASAISGIRNTTITITAVNNANIDDRTGHFFVFTHDGQIKKEITVRQEGTRSCPITLDNLEDRVFNGRTSPEYEHSVTVICDTHFTIEGPSWISAKCNGKEFTLDKDTVLIGSCVVYLKTNKTNDDEEKRKGTVCFKTVASSSSAQRADLGVTQLGAYDIELYEEIILCDVLATDIKYGAKVESFLVGPYKNKEDLTELFDYDYIIANWSYMNVNDLPILLGLQSNQDYSLYFIGVDAEKHVAPLSRIAWIPFSTPSEERQPRWQITGSTYSNGGFSFESQANEYAVAVGTMGIPFSNSNVYNVSTGLIKAYIAYQMMHNNNSWITDYVVGLLAQSDLAVGTWAIGMDSKLSKIMDVYLTDHFANQANRANKDNLTEGRFMQKHPMTTFHGRPIRTVDVYCAKGAGLDQIQRVLPLENNSVKLKHK